MRKYLSIFIKYKLELIFLAIISIIGSILGIVSVYFSGQYIDIVVDSTEINPILVICVIILIIAVLGLVLTFLGTFFKMLLNEKLIYDFKIRVLKHIRYISIIKYKNFDASYLSKRIDEDSQQIVRFFTDNYLAVFIRAIELIIVSVLIMTINHYIGILMIILCPTYFFIYKFFKRPIFERSLEAREKSAEFFQDYTYNLEKMENSIINSNFDKDDKLLNNAFSMYYKKYKSFIFVSAKLNLIQGLVIGLMQLFVFFIGGVSVLNGNTSIGLLTTIMVYFSQVLNNISYYLDLARKNQINKSSLHRIDEIFNIPKEIDGDYMLESVSSINVKINFSIGDNIILKNIRFHASKSELIGIFGKNGCGKSTLSKILTGVIKLKNDENSSIIFNNRYNMASLNSEYFRNIHLSYVHQTNYFKSSTLGEVFNNGFEHYNSAIEYLNDLKTKGIPLNSSIYDFILKNWNNKVNELSGGDRQLISILQGFSKIEAGLLIMDEPTSNLDKSRIDWFKATIKQLKQNKIIFLITHEHDMEEIFDKIIFIDADF